MRSRTFPDLSAAVCCSKVANVTRPLLHHCLHAMLQDKGPGGGRISREHLLEVATVARPTAPESPMHGPQKPQQHQRQPQKQQPPLQHGAQQLPRPYSAPTLVQSPALGDVTTAASAGGGAASPGSASLDVQRPSAAAQPAPDGTSPSLGRQSSKDAVAGSLPSSPSSTAPGSPEPPPTPSDAAVASGPPDLRVQTSASPAASPFAAAPGQERPAQEADAAGSEPPPPVTPPHSPPRASHSLSRAEQSADEEGSHGAPAVDTEPAQQTAQSPSPAAASAEERQAAVAAASGEAAERVAAAEAGIVQEAAELPDPKHRPGGHDQFSITIRNCRMLGPGLPHSLASGGIGTEHVIRELMPQVSRLPADNTSFPLSLLTVILC